jgi:hypothetical protein
MHRAVLSLYFLLLVSPLLAQQKPDAAQLGLQGHVRSLRVEVQQGNESQLRSELEQSFDPFGWQTELKLFGPDGKLALLSVFRRKGPRMIEADSYSLLAA